MGERTLQRVDRAPRRSGEYTCNDYQAFYLFSIYDAGLVVRIRYEAKEK
jgi:hypothetical protein